MKEIEKIIDLIDNFVEAHNDFFTGVVIVLFCLVVVLFIILGIKKN